jgi:hypothetical protein
MIFYVLVHQTTQSIQTRSWLSRGHCGYREVSCRDGSDCIPRGWDCDVIVDCQDGSDEDHCNHTSSAGILLKAIILCHIVSEANLEHSR